MSDNDDPTTEQPETVAARVYVPESVWNTAHRGVKNLLAERFGGYTAFEAEGGWVADDGQLIEETSIVYESVTDENNPEDVMIEAADLVKETAPEEDAVLWEIRPVKSMGFE